MACGCAVVQQKIGKTTWNVMKMCEMHDTAPKLLMVANQIANSGCDLGSSELRIRLYSAVTKAGGILSRSAGPKEIAEHPENPILLAAGPKEIAKHMEMRNRGEV
jgi:hypothetical protein